MKFVYTVLFSLVLVSAHGQKVKPANLTDLVMECMKSKGEASNKQMVLWIPVDFWEFVGEQMKMSPGFIENVVTEMSGYMMFCVVDYTVAPSGISFKTEEEIGKTLKLVDSSNTVYEPLSKEAISPEANRIIDNLRPVMAQMMGQFGQGMKIFLFPAKKLNGKPAVDIAKKNNFTLKWAQASMQWNLPFASVLPPKYCPIDNEQMKGTWNFCPIHGVKLSK